MNQPNTKEEWIVIFEKEFNKSRVVAEALYQDMVSERVIVSLQDKTITDVTRRRNHNRK